MRDRLEFEELAQSAGTIEYGVSDINDRDAAKLADFNQTYHQHTLRADL